MCRRGPMSTETPCLDRVTINKAADTFSLIVLTCESSTNCEDELMNCTNIDNTWE